VSSEKLTVVLTAVVRRKPMTDHFPLVVPG
jgi:hypothetical protein